MAKINKDEFIAGLKEMTMLEVMELVDAMKEEFGVDPSAVAVAAAPAASEEAAGPTTVTVTLTSAGPNKLPVIKLIKEVTGLGLKEAKAIADNGGAIKENIPSSEADELKAKLEEAGATVEVK